MDPAAASAGQADGEGTVSSDGVPPLVGITGPGSKNFGHLSVGTDDWPGCPEPAVSVRSDWASDAEGLSPARRHPGRLGDSDLQDSSSGDGGLSNMSAVTEEFQRSLVQRTTLTRSVSQCGKDRRPIRYGVHSIQNLRREMEDAHRAVLGDSRPPTREAVHGTPRSATDATGANLGPFSFFGVFDGHAGVRAAEFAGEHLYECLAGGREKLLANPVEALQSAFQACEADWIAAAREQGWMDGSTAAVALVDRGLGRCVVGNVGDSEVLIASRDDANNRTHKVLTEVHHMKRNPAEIERVRGTGGREWNGRLGHPKFNPHVVSLAVSRAIGDLFFKDEKYTDGLATGLTADPYIASTDIGGPGVVEQFIIIGCDGLWDTVNYETASNFVFDRLAAAEDPQAISEGLVNLAKETGSCDNITVLVAVLVEPINQG